MYVTREVVGESRKCPKNLEKLKSTHLGASQILQLTAQIIKTSNNSFSPNRFLKLSCIFRIFDWIWKCISVTFYHLQHHTNYQIRISFQYVVVLLQQTQSFIWVCLFFSLDGFEIKEPIISGWSCVEIINQTCRFASIN